jgi:hypothetical protein
VRESRSREAAAVEAAARADAERARLQRGRDDAAAALRVGLLPWRRLLCCVLGVSCPATCECSRVRLGPCKSSCA